MNNKYNIGSNIVLRFCFVKLIYGSKNLIWVKN